jgi:lipopolysaccharide biosynthesis regulator YciM
MNEALILVIFLAIAIGWWMGRYGLPSLRFFWQRPRTKEYLRGFTYLINEQSDTAVDTFLDQLDVTPNTLEMHIAIGTMLRRKGELDRAIRVHQNLLESQSLDASELSLAQLELARDFYSAGILDRVESILCDMVRDQTSYFKEAMRLLIDVYQDMQQWQDALDIATQLRRQISSSEETKRLCEAMGHYCCELAEEAIAKDLPKEAEDKIQQALTYYPGCVRASILAASLACRQGDEASAKLHLYKVADQDVSLFSEAIDHLSNLTIDEKSVDIVRKAHQAHPSHSNFVYLYNAINQQQGEEEAQHFLESEVSSRPSLTALDTYVAHQSFHKTDAEVRGVVRHTLQTIVARRDRYICLHCGFRGNQMHWLCPKCKRWGDIRQRHGL